VLGAADRLFAAVIGGNTPAETIVESPDWHFSDMIDLTDDVHSWAAELAA